VNLYVVVCDAFHAAYGPFADLELAGEASRRLNSISKCNHIPVTMIPMRKTVQAVGFVPQGNQTNEVNTQKRGYL